MLTIRACANRPCSIERQVMTKLTASQTKAEGNVEDAPEVVSNKILTVPNIISLVRLGLIPVFFALLCSGYDILATFIFALAASTDWVDGKIARSTNTVTRLGQLLDPAVDRLLMISGVLGLLMVGRLPLWIIVVVLARDLLLLVGGSILLSRYRIRVAVVFAGKAATTLLYIGFAGLLLNWPLIPGLALVDAAWLPGFNAEAVSWGIWFVYVGLALALFTTVYYIAKALSQLREAKGDEGERQA